MVNALPKCPHCGPTFPQLRQREAISGMIMRYPRLGDRRMLTPRNLAIVAAAALAVIPVSKAQACDNDRFPCPIISEAPSQDAAEAVPAAPAQPSKKKPTQAAQKPASAKSEGDTAQTPVRTKKPTGQDQANRAAKPDKPAVHEQASAASAPPAQALQVASPVPVLPEQLQQAATVSTESAPAPTPDISPASTGSPIGTLGTSTMNAQQVAAAGDFKLAERNEVNATAAAPAPTPAESSWKPYVLVLLGGALAAATMVRWFLRTRRGARPGLVPDTDASGASPV
jgi:hypothetical protein